MSDDELLIKGLDLAQQAFETFILMKANTIGFQLADILGATIVLAHRIEENKNK